MRAQPTLRPPSYSEAPAGFPLLIDGQWRAASGSARFAAHDPYLEQDWGAIADAQPADIDAAVLAAAHAFADGRWSNRLASVRARSLLQLADLIERDAEALTQQQILENGKLVSEMRPGMATVAGACRFIRLTRPLGADLAGQFDRFHGEPVDRRSSKPDAVVYAYPFGILVNRDAQRFFDEGADSFDATFEQLGYEIWAHQRQEAYFIAEKAILEWPNVANIILTDQPPIEASTVESLARQLGLDPRALALTVARYNAAIGPGETDRTIRDGKAARDLVPPKSNWATPIQNAPFIGYPLTCAMTFTFGGIRSDSKARVVRRDGTPIEALYAAGEVTGIYYGSYPAGTSVLRALTFGRIAACEAACAER